MTLDELRRFLLHFGIQLMDENLDNEEKRELVALCALIKREINLKLLGQNPNATLIRY